MPTDPECPLCGYGHPHECAHSMFRARTVTPDPGWEVRSRTQGADPPGLWSAWTTAPLPVEGGDLVEARPRANADT